MKQGLYRGFSTYEYQKRKKFNVYDIDLVKLDLLNHIYTVKGTRVMHPNFGTRIPILAFEPMDSITLDILEEDLRSVIAFDPRVQLIDLRIEPYYDQNFVIARVRLLYIELDIVDDMNLNIEFVSQ